MFDIGFPELMLVSVIALIVIGPEKLPETIRTLSLWLGRLRRSFATIKSEIEAEIGADDIRRQLREESVLDELKETRMQLEEVIDTTRKDLTAIGRSATAVGAPDAADSNISESPDGATESSMTASADAKTASNDSNPDSENPKPASTG